MMLRFVAALLLHALACAAQAQAPSRTLSDGDLRCIEAPTRDCTLALVRVDADAATAFSRVEIGAALAEALAELGRFNEAFAAAEGIMHTVRRNIAFWKVTRTLLRDGRLADVVARLRSAPSNAYGVFRAGIERDVADALIAGGQLNEALAAARSFESSTQRVVTLARLAGPLRNPVLLQEAEGAVASIGLGWERAWALFELARAGGDAATLERARAESRLIREPIPLGLLAARIAPLGFDDATRAIIGEIRASALAIDHPANRLKALIHLASVTREPADFRAATVAADQLPAPFSSIKSSFLFQIGEEQIRARFYREAAVTARSIRPNDALFIGLIARAAAGLRDRALFAEAKSAARAQTAPVFRDMHLATIALFEFNSRLSTDGLATAEAIETPAARALIEAPLVRALAETGRHGEALRRARSITAPDKRGVATAGVAPALPN